MLGGTLGGKLGGGGGWLGMGGGARDAPGTGGGKLGVFSSVGDFRDALSSRLESRAWALSEFLWETGLAMSVS